MKTNTEGESFREVSGKKLLLSIIAPLVVLTLLPLSFSACRSRPDTYIGTVIYVSPEGNDNWSGTARRPARSGNIGPFRTVARARDHIRTLKQQHGTLSEPVHVLLDSGVYPQSETLIFTPEDSGTAASPIIYRALPGAKAVISGGVEVKGWESATIRNADSAAPLSIWQLKLPPHSKGKPWNFNQLYVNNINRIRARTPNKGEFLRSDGTTGANESREFYFKEGDIGKQQSLQNALFVVYHSWATSLHTVEETDHQAGIITFNEPARWPMGRWESQQRYYIENLFEALDEPGEWYFDTGKQTLYYYPMPGETMAKTSVTIPILNATLITLLGNPDKAEYVEHIHFSDIAIRHTNTDLSKIHNSGQADIHQAALVMCSGVRRSSFERCEISCAGAHAIWLTNGSSETIIRQCHLHTLGGGGVYIGGGWDVGGNLPTSSNTVDNCFIHNAGNLFHGAHGVWIGRSSYNKITHNEIKNIDYSGISCGWSWGFQPSSANHNNIDFNYIHHLSNGEGLSDMGGIYTLGVSPGTTLRNNHIHDVYSYAHVSHGSGLYPDEGSSHILLEDNVVYRVRSSPLFMHYGADCIVRNNILALGGKGQLRRSREDKRCHYEAVGNIVYSTHPAMLDGPWKNNDWLVASNIYWSVEGEPVFDGKTLKEWQAAGNDVGSIIADPLFKNPAQGDFRLKQGSPALKAGFRPIDITKAGLYGSKEWCALPAKFPNRELIEIAAPVKLPIQINYDFEDLLPGSKPLDARIHIDGKASVKVSDELSASGGNSLKFTDASGLRARWLPHLEYMRQYTNGVITLSWDLLNSAAQPADFTIELRDYSGTQFASGPSINVNSKGEVRANGVSLGSVAHNRWAHITITLELNNAKPSKYAVRLEQVNAPSIDKTIPLRDNKFKIITWLGIMSNSDRTAHYYIDNLRMGTEEELAKPPKRRARRKQK